MFTLIYGEHLEFHPILMLYFLSIIDDYSRKAWIYILRHKMDTFEKFKNCKPLVVYLINKCLSTAINFKNPQEMWFGNQPKYDHLRIFGYTVYAHVSDGKLDTRAIKCIFLGYPESVKGYKLWVYKLGKYKYYVSRDVIVNELKMAKPKKTILKVELYGKDSDSSNVEIEVK